MVLAAAAPVYLYNSSLFKPWYLSGQVEVYCLMSSMWPQSGMCAADRRLCPVSDWGLGLVTAPPLPVLSIGCPLPLGEVRGWLVEMRGAAEAAGMEGAIGCLDGSMDCFQ